VNDQQAALGSLHTSFCAWLTDHSRMSQLGSRLQPQADSVVLFAREYGFGATYRLQKHGQACRK
jgi:hypothetical protein